MKIRCYFESQVWKKDSSIAPSLFSLIFCLDSLASPFSVGFFGHFYFFPHMGQCSNNEDHHIFIYLQLKKYNSVLRTKYDSI